MSPRAGSDAEQRVEADGEARTRRHLLAGEQHAGHEGRAVVRVVADAQALPRGSEQYLLVRYESAQADGMHRDAVDARARAPAATVVVVGSASQSLDAADMRWAVVIAVPDGASIFAS